MISSLRSRQLVSSFGVIMTGILILGIMLHRFSYEQKIEGKQTYLREVAFDLLGHLEFQDSQFKIVEGMYQDVHELVTREDLASGKRDKFAYVLDVTKKEVIWSAASLGPPARAVGLDNPDYFLRFNIPPTEVSYQPKFFDLQPEPPRSPEDASDPIYQQKFLLAVQTFSYQPYGKYQFIVGMSIEDVHKEMQEMRKNFAILLFVSAVLVLIAQLALSYWVVAPIKEFEDEVKSIESGEREKMTNTYPDELTPVQNALNGLLGYEKGQKQRYKDSLDDLAHSLKTPLTALRNQLDSLMGHTYPDNPSMHSDIKALDAQVHRMHEIISYQLGRAIVTKPGPLLLSKPLRPILFRLRETLQKVYCDKAFELRVTVDEYAKCRMDDGDMMELFGNLLNNACRFCKEIVEVSAHHSGNMLVLDIDDDGIGFPDENPSQLLQRGVREDSKTEGQGIGLATSTEIVSAIGGRIELLVSPYVGARVRLHLPI